MSVAISLILLSIIVSSKFTEFILLSLIYVGYFLPLLLQHIINPKVLLTIDYFALEQILGGLVHIKLTDSYILIQGSGYKGLYELTCSASKALMFALYPFAVRKCPCRRKFVMSFLGIILGLPISWIRLYIMVILAKIGIDFVMLHYTVSPLITLMLGIIVFDIQSKVCKSVYEEFSKLANLYIKMLKSCKVKITI
jgi:hypothetical protein